MDIAFIAVISNVYYMPDYLGGGISRRKMVILACRHQIFAVLYKIPRHLMHKQRQDSLKYVVGKHGVTAGTLAVQSKANRPVFGMKKVNHQASPHTRE
ncbi:hypothetical protein [Janthinobacterium sp. UMAB-56]|uniref:hypothetical protein n=1 Tax=Janthinobacterium sp. UMAB-56 TaxID=1365361 RepID=UPI001C55D8F5|nr:hypothetical protein [Janthinobacterium sp. UMAB-56]